jgi:endo-1,4-beta-xylanase
MEPENGKGPFGFRANFRIWPGMILMVWASLSHGQIAKAANKYLGNITGLGKVPAEFETYWNQITPESETHWGAIEPKRDSLNWKKADSVARFAASAGMPWTFHALFGGSQFPAWMTGLGLADQGVEIEEWLDAVRDRYPDLALIHVVNEGHPKHAPAPYRNALGGDGESGFAWIFKAFQLARQRWPHAVLVYNDYNNIEYDAEIDWTVDLIEAALEAGIPIDAIGCEAHDAHKVPASTLKSNLDRLAATGMPILITEYDIGNSNDTLQLATLREQFPVFWNHPSVAGVTYFGFRVGETWNPWTGLLTTAGVERPALVWLQEYVRSHPTPENRFPFLLRREASVILTGRSKPVRFDPSGSVRDRRRLWDGLGRTLPEAQFKAMRSVPAFPRPR